MSEQDEPQGHDVTALIRGMQGGNAAARDQLVALVHQELHRRARWAVGRPDQQASLQPTALVNEAWLRIQERSGTWNSRDHFLAVAATAMRNLVIDRARRRRSAPTSDDQEAFLDGLLSVYDEEPIDVLDLHEALEELGAFDPEAARLVELRYFIGASAEEAALAAGIAPRTATRKHEFAKRWLRNRLEGGADA